jgi:hypothetical protein
MDRKPRAPQKTLASSRLITMSLKLPRSLTPHKFQQNPLQDNPKNSPRKTTPDFFEKFKKLEFLNNGKWMIPQRVDSSSPEGKTLSFLMAKIKGEYLKTSLKSKATPFITFSKQTFRPPLPCPTFHEEKSSTSPVRPKSPMRELKKVVIVKENVIKEIEILTNRSKKKSYLKDKLLMLKQTLIKDIPFS